MIFVKPFLSEAGCPVTPVIMPLFLIYYFVQQAALSGCRWLAVSSSAWLGCISLLPLEHWQVLQFCEDSPSTSLVLCEVVTPRIIYSPLQNALNWICGEALPDLLGN
jgi:hypothetical protein